MVRTPQPRRRQARSLANDARILDAVVTLLDSKGWEETSITGIAAQAGLTHPAVLDRYSNRAAAVVAAWDERIAADFRRALSALISVVDTQPVDADSLLDVLDYFVYPTPATRAAAEVLLVARYDTTLAEAVDRSVGSDLQEWLTPTRGRLTRAQAARRGFVIGLAIGTLIESRLRIPEDDFDLTQDVWHIAAALSTRELPTKLPSERAEHLFEPPRFDLQDPALEDLLAATLEEVGEFGFEAATVKRIASRAGYTTGLIFRRYDHKLSLFLDATQRMLAQSGVANQEYQVRIAAATSPGVADATMTREFMRPEHRQLRTIAYEQYRIAWHDPVMQGTFAAAQDEILAYYVSAAPELSLEQARGRTFLAFARGAGMGALADLSSSAADLPYDVVSVPLVELSGGSGVLAQDIPD